MNPKDSGNKKPIPGKVDFLAGLVAVGLESVNVIIMFVRHTNTQGQLIASFLIICLGLYWLVTGKKKMDEWKKTHPEE